VLISALAITALTIYIPGYQDIPLMPNLSITVSRPGDSLPIDEVTFLAKRRRPEEKAVALLVKHQIAIRYGTDVRFE
jgi:hypothetical protein